MTIVGLWRKTGKTIPYYAPDCTMGVLICGAILAEGGEVFYVIVG